MKWSEFKEKVDKLLEEMNEAGEVERDPEIRWIDIGSAPADGVHLYVGPNGKNIAIDTF